jgi:hypothetical protein
MTTAEKPSAFSLEPCGKSKRCDPKMKIAAKTLNIYVTININPVFSQ